MKKSFLLATFFALASTLVAAQTPAPSGQPQPSAQSFTFSLNAPTSCPVSLRALQGSGGGLLKARNAEPSPPQSSQSIHLVLSDLPARVVSAKVLVRGLSGKDQIMRTLLTSGSESSNLVRTLDVRFSREDDKSVATDLALPGFTSVRSVELESIRYEDGSTWAVPAGKACRVAPDPFMLVTTH